ncbi:MAG: carboxypeptidase-like regulatory domain-containing protein, partial [Bacteroidota bacterium]|nr:carboxypeptidase-like regulatory domain-containing protein [Bacteroidota bacterium]
MVKHFPGLAFIFFFSQYAFSQHTLKGKVINDETKLPLPSVSVYLNNTSLGTVTNENGVFVISKIPSGKFRLIASSIGYETYVLQIDPKEIPRDFVISLKIKPEELKGFAVLPPEPDGWKKWGKIFTDIFIGTTPNSNNCRHRLKVMDEKHDQNFNSVTTPAHKLMNKELNAVLETAIAELPEKYRLVFVLREVED